METQKQLIQDNCGQTCVAMIAGISQWDAMHAVGNDHGTQPKYLQEALFRFGFNVERKRFVKAEWPPKLAIALVRDRFLGDYGHAVVVRDGQVIDPALGRPMPADRFLELLRCNGRYITALIVVNGKRY